MWSSFLSHVFMWKVLYSWASPKIFFDRAGQCYPWFFVLACMAIAIGMVWGLVFVPPDYQQGDAFRIIYVHVPCAFLSLFLYVVLAFLSILLFIYGQNFFTRFIQCPPWHCIYFCSLLKNMIVNKFEKKILKNFETFCSLKNYSPFLPSGLMTS